MTDADFANEIMDGFNHLSIADLLAAREQYHVFLTKHPNVVATAIGRYLIRKPGVIKDGDKEPKPPRTLDNSYIDQARSWPCVLVFVDQWQSEEELVKTKSPGAVIPKTLYLPDGRAVPVCIVQAHRDEVTDDAPVASKILYPSNLISGGYPLIVQVQGREHLATVGCLVTDGSRYYGLTNRHVCGESGRVISTCRGNTLARVGIAADKSLQLAKVPFADLYPGWPGVHLSINVDVGLVDIDDVNEWRTDIFKLGPIQPLLDINVDNLSLSIIGKPVRGFGAGSGEIRGQIAGLFYRYRSMGGMEYVSDYLIGPLDTQRTVTRHGDSGAVLALEIAKDMWRPFAITWGAHEFANAAQRSTLSYALATGLGNVCRLLDIDIVRGWNTDQPYTWGKTGHFKIGFRAADLISDENLAQFLIKNQDSLGYSNDALSSQAVVTGKYTHDFVPLADVADIIWRSTRPDDESNHFCDIDETDAQVFDGKSLLELSLDDEKNIDPAVWLAYDQQMDAVRPTYKAGTQELRPREGALPFRVWQMYEWMIAALQAKRLDVFLAAGGTVAHYTGDACQPLHISYLHHGADASESGVHSDYETTLIDRKMDGLFAGVDAIATKVSDNELIGADGKAAAKLILELMAATVERLPPEQVLDSWRQAKGRGKYDRMWNDLGAQTIENIAAGAHAMAVLWQSAWKHGGGDSLQDELDAIPQENLQKIYNNKNFAPSCKLSDVEHYQSELQKNTVKAGVEKMPR